MQHYTDKHKIKKCSYRKVFAYRLTTCCSKLVKKVSDKMGAIFCEPNILHGWLGTSNLASHVFREREKRANYKFWDIRNGWKSDLMILSISAWEVKIFLIRFWIFFNTIPLLTFGNLVWYIRRVPFSTGQLSCVVGCLHEDMGLNPSREAGAFVAQWPVPWNAACGEQKDTAPLAWSPWPFS